MEAQYAHRLEKRGQLEIVYVMLDENYTTLSSPESVSGWLGLIIGEAMWQRCFCKEDGQVGEDDLADTELVIRDTYYEILVSGIIVHSCPD